MKFAIVKERTILLDGTIAELLVYRGNLFWRVINDMFNLVLFVVLLLLELSYTKMGNIVYTLFIRLAFKGGGLRG